MVSSAEEFDLHRAVSTGDIQTLREKSESGALQDSIDLPGQDGGAPLHLAARNCDIEIVELLLLSGASVACVDTAGLTPAQIATDSHADADKKVVTLSAIELAGALQVEKSPGKSSKRSSKSGSLRALSQSRNLATKFSESWPAVREGAIAELRRVTALTQIPLLQKELARVERTSHESEARIENLKKCLESLRRVASGQSTDGNGLVEEVVAQREQRAQTSETALDVVVEELKHSVKDMKSYHKYSSPPEVAHDLFLAVRVLLCDSMGPFVEEGEAIGSDREQVRRQSDAFLQIKVRWKQKKSIHSFQEDLANVKKYVLRDDVDGLRHAIAYIRPLLNDESFTPQHMNKVSELLGVLCRWVHLVIMLYDSRNFIHMYRESLSCGDKRHAAEEAVKLVEEDLQALVSETSRGANGSQWMITELSRKQDEVLEAVMLAQKGENSFSLAGGNWDRITDLVEAVCCPQEEVDEQQEEELLLLELKSSRILES
ncbi:hypothetical protein CYMTET_9437 [Cymbomonas tetramitiformis]|uniref:Uncharacterized protein n=1 Tax=Cymbomonas tetramitiformis TaxID=36881 RepID=A0AAE0LEV5_9CHLO|nr:hypothetical protein CYMTET_9437 [Cymbomonas tetramitiformis]|eukprot:gene2353-3081_t